MGEGALSVTADRIRIARWAAVAIAAAVMVAWLTYTPAGALGKADAIGYAVCHRIDLRSFHLGDRTLPLCSRCTGTYLGAMTAFLAAALAGRSRAGLLPPRRVLIALGLIAVPFVIDGTNSFLSFFPNAPQPYEPANSLRLITGLLLGAGLGTTVWAGFHGNAWRDWSRKAPLVSLKELGALLAVLAVLAAAVLTENPLILYPLALVSSAGVIVLLTSVHTMLVLLLTRRENLAQGWSDLIFPGLMGLTLAVLQVGFIDLARFFATGTWDGFHL
jgi:uncharacterized membrane protein